MQCGRYCSETDGQSYCSERCREADAAHFLLRTDDAPPGSPAAELAELLAVPSESSLFLPLAVRMAAGVVAEASASAKRAPQAREEEMRSSKERLDNLALQQREHIQAQAQREMLHVACVKHRHQHHPLRCKTARCFRALS